MTDAQQLAAFCAAPFLALSAFWIIGLALLATKAVPVRVKKEERK